MLNHVLVNQVCYIGAVISDSWFLDILPELRLLAEFILAFIVASTAFFSDIFFE